MTGFYEKLGITPAADREEIRAGYHRALGLLVRKLRRARENGADTAALEARRDELQEAYEVLSDPGRRRLYDGFLALEGGDDVPAGLDAFWARVRDSVADPAAAAAVELVRALTALPVGDALDAGIHQSVRPVAIRSAVEEPSPAPQPAAPPVEVPPIDPSSEPLPGPAAGVQLDAGAPLPGGSDLGAPPAPASPDDPVLDVARLAETYGYDGRYLQAVRQLRGVTLDEVAAETQLALRYLEAIEINDFARLPAAVFVRGYLREIADVLEIEEVDELVDGYMKRYASYRGD